MQLPTNNTPNLLIKHFLITIHTFLLPLLSSGVNVSGAKTFGIVILPNPNGRGTIPLPHPNINGPVPGSVQDIVDEAHARARLAKLPDSPVIYLSKVPNPGPWTGPEPFNKYIHTHPNSIGPGAVCPEDIWDDMIPPRESEVVNLYSVRTNI